MEGNKNKIIIAAAVVVLVVIIIAAVSLRNRSTKTQNSSTSGTTAANEGPSVGAPGNATSATHTAAPNLAVPDEGAATGSVSANVAIPTVQGPAAPGVSASYRSFNITLAKGQFSPSEVIVNYGDTVNLNITATDGNYDYYQPDYGNSTQLPEGVMKVVQFQANNPGKFEFYCQSCGGPSSGPVGYIVVEGGPTGSTSGK